MYALTAHGSVVLHSRGLQVTASCLLWQKIAERKQVSQNKAKTFVDLKDELKLIYISFMLN